MTDKHYRSLAFLFIALLSFRLHAANTNGLALVKRILLPNVSGPIEHFALDTTGQRLFVSAAGNNTVEVIDLAAGKHVGTIGNCIAPQGLAYIPAKKWLAVANGGSGTVKILDGISFKVLNSLGDFPDADKMIYEAKTDLLYIGYGETLGIVRVASGELTASIKLPGHIESFLLEQNGSRIFVNVPDAQQVAVVDREMRTIVDTWRTTGSHGNFPLALDEASHRLFIGCRQPPQLMVYDTETGRKVDDVDISTDVDDLSYDALRKQVYASCGGGFVDVISQTDPDTHQLHGHIPTMNGARTSCFSPERGELYVAMPGSMMSGSAEIRVFKGVR